MERIFSKVKIFLLKKIVFPVLQMIAKYMDIFKNINY
jgi:hypothetical protein